MLTSLILSLTAGAMAQEKAGKFDDHWLADFDKAVEVAKKEGKDLLVDFTGSDWCGWCIKLHHEVFDHQAFIDGAESEYVLVALDYPRSEGAKAKVPNPTRNGELSETYGISGFPTILLMTAEGDAYGRLGYEAGGPDAWIKSMNATRESGMQRHAELVAFGKKVEAAKGAEKGKLYDETLARLEKEPEDSPFRRQIAGIARTAYAADKDNAQGVKLKVLLAILKSGAAGPSDFAAGSELDPKNAKGVLEQVVMARVAAVNSEEKVKAACKWIDDLDALGPIQEKEIAKRLYANAALWNDRYVKSPEQAKKYARKAKEIGVENPDLDKALDKILAG